MNNNYDDIINKPYIKSNRHIPMSLENRAAQFSPFAALTGYEAIIEETGRLTDRSIELDENMRDKLDMKLQSIMAAPSKEMVQITYFQPDALKEGGSYKKVRSVIKKLDEYERVLVLEDGSRIDLGKIIEIEEAE